MWRQLSFADVLEGDSKVSGPKILWVKCWWLERTVYQNYPEFMNALSFYHLWKARNRTSTLASSRSKNIKINPFLRQVTIIVKDFQLTGALNIAKYLLEDCPFTPVGVYRKLLFGANEIPSVWWQLFGTSGYWATYLGYKSLLTARGNVEIKIK